MTTTSIPPTPPKAAEQTSEPSIELQEQIRCRAYELYEKRGREDGCDLDDWLRAESELTQKMAKAVGA